MDVLFSLRSCPHFLIHEHFSFTCRCFSNAHYVIEDILHVASLLSGTQTYSPWNPL
jgi:hypothetical protein